MPQALKRTIYQLHLWTGLLTGLVAALLGLSGTVLIFRGELEHAFRPEMQASQPFQRNVSLQPILESYLRSHPERKLRALQLPASGKRDPLVLMFGAQSGIPPARVAIDFSTGRELTFRDDWISWIVRLHHTLFLRGHFYTGLAGVALSILCLTGIVVWWNTARTFTYDIALRPARLVSWRARDLHIFAGFWTLVPLFILAFSGTVFTWRDAYTKAALFVTRAQQPQKRYVASDPRPINLDQLVSAARAAVPNADATFVRMPEKPGTPVVVRLRAAGDTREAGSTQVFLNSRAEILGVEALADKPLGARLVEALAPLHTGEIGGWPLKTLWAVIGFVPALLFMTGVRAAWRKYVRAYPKKISSGTLQFPRTEDLEAEYNQRKA